MNSSSTCPQAQGVVAMAVPVAEPVDWPWSAVRRPSPVSRVADRPGQRFHGVVRGVTELAATHSRFRESHCPRHCRNERSHHQRRAPALTIHDIQHPLRLPPQRFWARSAWAGGLTSRTWQLLDYHLIHLALDPHGHRLPEREVTVQRRRLASNEFEVRVAEHDYPDGGLLLLLHDG